MTNAKHYMSKVTGVRFYCETCKMTSKSYADEDDACDAAAAHDENHRYDEKDGAE